MGERYVREVYDDDLHLADSTDDDGSHRSLQYDDDNKLKSHAKYYDVDEKELYDELREKYEDSDAEYIPEIDIEELQKKAETLFAIGAIAAGVIHYVSPYVKDWVKETAIPGVKTAFRSVKGKFKRNQQDDEEVVEISLDVNAENSLAFANEIEEAERQYRKKMTSEEAQQKFLRMVLHAMELSKEMNELANADIEDEEALAKKNEWLIVEHVLSKESLIEGINNILSAGEDAFTKEQTEMLEDLLNRKLYQQGEYVPLSGDEIKGIVGDNDPGDEGEETDANEETR